MGKHTIFFKNKPRIISAYSIAGPKEAESNFAKHISELISDDRFGEMLNYAVRYALGRQSYAPHDVVNYITPLLPRLSHRTLFVMAKDIEETDSYGDERIDKPMWLKFLAEVKKHLNNKTADFVEVNKMIEQ